MSVARQRSAGELRTLLPGRTIVSVGVHCGGGWDDDRDADTDETYLSRVQLRLDDGTELLLTATGCCCYSLEAATIGP